MKQTNFEVQHIPLWKPNNNLKQDASLPVTEVLIT